MLLLNKYLKIKLLLLVVALFLFKNSRSQNLIQNGGFEISTNNDCYGSFDHHIFPNPHILNNWYNFNSPDYFSNTCVGWYSIPNAYFGNSYAEQGNSFVGIGVYDIRNNYQEYAYQQLSSPLQAGKIYCLSFFVSRGDRTPFAIKNIGAYFSNSLPYLIGGEYIGAIPQVENVSGFIADTVQWTKIQGCFTAIGGEQYLTIGNFNDNSNTDTLRIQSANLLTGTGTDIAYYYIDDITLIDQTTVGVNELDKENGFKIYPNPVKDVLNINYKKGNKDQISIKLIDIIGNEVLIEKYKEGIDISNLEKGIYFLSVYNINQLMGTRKVIKE